MCLPINWTNIFTDMDLLQLYNGQDLIALFHSSLKSFRSFTAQIIRHSDHSLLKSFVIQIIQIAQIIHRSDHSDYSEHSSFKSFVVQIIRHSNHSKHSSLELFVSFKLGQNGTNWNYYETKWEFSGSSVVVRWKHHGSIMGGCTEYHGRKVGGWYSLDRIWTSSSE